MKESILSAPVLTDEELLTKTQRYTFKYFWDYASSSGMAYERIPVSGTGGNPVTSGGSGFGVMAILVGIERAFITREQGRLRIEKIVDFLTNSATNYKGGFAHWMNGDTGETVPFSVNDNGADLVETSFMMQGLITARQYFNQPILAEEALVVKINVLWNNVDWNYFTFGTDRLYWHCNNELQKSSGTIVGWNECMITYMLAVASPTHPIDPSLWQTGWSIGGSYHSKNQKFYDITLPIGDKNSKGGPLFFAHYSFLGFNPKNLRDTYNNVNYFQQNQAHTLINRAYCEENPLEYVGYGENQAWGLTASDGNKSYSAHSPGNDRGVVAPTAAISSMPYTPKESLAALRYFYEKLGTKIWNEKAGFIDSFNETVNWGDGSYLAIDQGPIICMIENYRSGMLWDYFMSAPEIQTALGKLNFKLDFYPRVIIREPYVLDNFENGKINFTDKLILNPKTDMQAEVVDNPDRTGSNQSKKVLKFERTGNSAMWAGCDCTLNVTLSEYKYLYMKYYRNNPNSQIKANISNGPNNEFLSQSPLDKQNEWGVVVFDLLSNKVKDITRFSLQPDFTVNHAIGDIIYIDELTFSDTEIDLNPFYNNNPKELKATNIQTNSISLSWDVLSKVTSYDVFKEGVFYQNVTTNSVVITGLNSFDIYYFTVRGRNDNLDISTKMSTSLYVTTEETKLHKDQRMAWWREAGFGLFLHWGAYSGLAGHYTGPTLMKSGPYIGPDYWMKDYYSSYRPEWINPDGTIKTDPETGEPYKQGAYSEWIMFAAQIPRAEYKTRWQQNFTAENFSASEWIRMAKDAGMKYIVITAKHHEGFALMHTHHVGYNIQDDTNIAANILKNLVVEAHAAGLKIGFYYSQCLDWMNPGGMGWMPQNETPNHQASYYEQAQYTDTIVIPHIQTMINDYDIDLIWWDMGGGSTPEFRYRMMKAIKNIPGSDRLIFNNRMNDGLTGDYTTPEQNIPNMPPNGDGSDWETCMTMNDNWGYDAYDPRWKTEKDLIQKLIDIVSKGGNFLLNIGPEADGTFPPEAINRLDGFAVWMAVNKMAIEKAQPSPYTTQLPWGRATRKIVDSTQYLYLHVFAENWPHDGNLLVPNLREGSVVKAYFLADTTKTALNIIPNDNASGYIIPVPDTPLDSISTTIVLEMSEIVNILFTFSKQSKDDILNLNAVDAVTTELMIENGPLYNLGGWINDTSFATWHVEVIQSGNFFLDVVAAGYSGQFILKVDGVDQGPYQFTTATADFNKYQTLSLGTINLPAGIYNIELHRISNGGWDPVNVRQVSIHPKIDTTPIIIQNADKTLTLPAQSAILHGTGIMIEHAPNYNIGGWTNPDAYAAWRVKVNQEGIYHWQSELAGCSGKFQLMIKDRLSIIFPFTTVNSDFSNYQIKQLGDVYLQEGVYYIELHRISNGGWDPVNVRNITFYQDLLLNTTEITDSDLNKEGEIPLNLQENSEEN
ncbi:alpha-L-fucosidase [Flavobacterium sp. MC2016-06]|jgi:alpha-L-fucosidase|uniref:alpha-L-fucosidase n=1 Tax=Flavobacterium sp. MC2016-06 TaxID=2676308 RepID=UPI0012BABF0E|nr:alpha-L-fucosidase [Flavobacterium sp. MC2016-06]MBU3860412.1 alpha-L-fucosidase [Flavobacterium sp. MC2016-06]